MNDHGDRRCTVCGQRIVRRAKRGRIPDTHPKCRELLRAFNTMTALLHDDEIRMTDEKERAMRADLLRAANALNRLHTDGRRVARKALSETNNQTENSYG